MGVLIVKVLIGLVYVFMVGMNTLANALPFFGRTTGEVSEAFPNPLTPSGFAFSIWGLIYVLLGIMVIRLLMMDGEDLSTPSTRLFITAFIASSIFNGLWLLAWHSLISWLSLLVMVGLLASLVLAYLNVPQNEWWMKVAISIYLGWISVATLLNVTIVLTTTDFFVNVSETLYFIAIIILGIGIAFALLRQGDVPYALVFTWAYFAIFIRHLQEDNLLFYTTAGTAGILILLMVLFTVYLNGYGLYPD
ncbi:MAG: tryptophan-rich sensory protein [Candidatus Izemoplasmataceae bacterium]